MAIDARPNTPRPHPSHAATSEDGPSTEGTSSLLADDAEELPAEADDLELPGDIELSLEEDREDALFAVDESLDDLDAPADEPEVEDTPGDDALIAAARIARFDEAHETTAPVDFGPFDEEERGITDDAELGDVDDPTLVGKPRARAEDDESANVENTRGGYRR